MMMMMMISTGLDHPVSQQKNRLAGPPLHTRDSRVCITNKQKNVACKGKRGGPAILAGLYQKTTQRHNKQNKKTWPVRANGGAPPFWLVCTKKQRKGI